MAGAHPFVAVHGRGHRGEGARTMITSRGEEANAGFAAVELVAGIALLLLPVASVVFTVPTWSERQSAARAIVREIARGAVVTGACDEQSASVLARAMAVNLGVPGAAVTVELECPNGFALVPGGDVAAAVTVRMPAVHLPARGDVGAWGWTARHRQPVDRYLGTP